MSKTDRTNPPQVRRQYADDEIDLLELFAIVWGGKWLIVAVVGVSALLALLAVQTMPPVYRIEAVLAGPSPYSIQVLQPSPLMAGDPDQILQPSTLTDGDPDQTLQPSTLMDGDPYQVGPLTVEAVYAAGLAQASSLHTKKAFWEKKIGRPLVLSDPGVDPTDDERAFREFVADLQVRPPESVKDGGALIYLSLESVHPEQGVKLLTDYAEFVDQYTVARLIDRLEGAYDASLDRLAGDYHSLTAREKLELDDELVRLREAYGVAKALGIEATPYDRIENVQLALFDNREYLLGTMVLAGEMSAVKARQQSLGAFVPQLRVMERWKGQMERDRRRVRAAAADVNALLVLSPPGPSLEPVKPNKLLIITAAVFGAALLGVVLVFIRHAARGYRARYSPASEPS